MNAIQLEFRFPRQFKWIDPLVREIYGDALERAGRGQLAAIGRQYALDDAIATGKTFATFDISTVMQTGNRMEIEIAPHGDRAQVVSYLEFGTKASSKMPSEQMRANVREWLEARNIISAGDQSERANALIWAVSAHILHEGLEPRYLLDKAKRKYKPSVARIFEAATRRLAKAINERLNADER